MSLLNLKLSRFQLQILAIIYRTLTSAIFNLVMFTFGFGAGLATVAINVHQQAKRTSTWEIMSEIQNQVVEMSQLDVNYAAKQRKICGLLGDLRVKIAHDSQRLHVDSSVECLHDRQQKDSRRDSDVRPATDVR